MTVNDDLISRKAAIEEALHALDNDFDGWFRPKYVKCVTQAISDLPSAQRWIPVSEGLPDPPRRECSDVWNMKSEIIFGETYIVMIDGAEVPTTLYWTNRGEWRHQYDSEPYNVIAWMRMPAPYKPEEGK